MKKDKRVTSPCFFIHFDTFYKLERLQRKLGLSKSVVLDIAIGLTDEKEIQSANISRSARNGTTSKQQEHKEQTLF